MRVVVQDLATQWIQSYPCTTKSAEETQRSLGQVSRPEDNLRSMFTDTSLEFFQACVELNWTLERSTPYRSEKHGFSERAVWRVKERISSVLFQYGLRESLREEATECYCYLRNVQDLLADSQTPNERRFNSPCEGPIIPFGAEVKFYPISSKDHGRVHHFGTEVFPGMFKGHAMNAAEVGLVIFW